MSVRAHRGLSLFVLLCAVCSMAAVALLASLRSGGVVGGYVALVLAVSLLSSLETHTLPGGGTSSSAHFPIVVAMLLWPKWYLALLWAMGFGIIRATQPHASPLRVTFAFVQCLLTLSLAGSIYLIAGGSPAAFGPSSSFERAVRLNALPASLLLVSTLLANTTLVSGALSLSGGQRFLSVWRSRTVTLLPTMALLLPATFVVAYMLATGGVAGALLLGLSFAGFRFFQQQSFALQQVSQDLLELTIKAIEARDPYTSGHSRRVSSMVGSIASELRLPERDLQHAVLAGLLHDVGKMHETFAPILRKPGRLTEAEWMVMRTHSALGAELVATVAHLRPLVPAIRNHHEFWDGTGYPDGLAGERIPLAARIIAVADTIDALSTERPYRVALGAAEVRAELVRGRGTQFDPRIVDAALSANLWERLLPQAAVRHNPGVLSISRRLRPAAQLQPGT